MTQITLEQGDWTRSPLTKQEHYNVCIAFIRAGAERGEAFDYDEFSAQDVISWDIDNEIYHPTIDESCNNLERELTYEQIMNATNSGFSDFSENLRNKPMELHKEKIDNEDQDKSNNPENKKCECGKYSHMTGGNHLTDCHNSPDNKKPDNPNCNGEFTPQSGDICQYFSEDEPMMRKDCNFDDHCIVDTWISGDKLKVIMLSNFSFSDNVVIVHNLRTNEVSTILKRYLRPILSDREVVIEKAIKEIVSKSNEADRFVEVLDISTSDKILLEYLYDAGMLVIKKDEE